MVYRVRVQYFSLHSEVAEIPVGYAHVYLYTSANGTWYRKLYSVSHPYKGRLYKIINI